MATVASTYARALPTWFSDKQLDADSEAQPSCAPCACRAAEIFASLGDALDPGRSETRGARRDCVNAMEFRDWYGILLRC